MAALALQRLAPTGRDIASGARFGVGERRQQNGGEQSHRFSCHRPSYQMR
jgi:hypothetical protein